MIDLSRLVTGFCFDVLTASGLHDRFFELLFKASEWDTPWSLPLTKSRETNILLLLRTLANAFQGGAPIDEGTWVNQVCVAIDVC